MRNAITWSGLCVVGMLGCTQPRPVTGGGPLAPERLDAWPSDWAVLEGKTVTVDGYALNAKIGPMLTEDRSADTGLIWLDGHHRWPDWFYRGTTKGDHIRITGTVIQRSDMPVYLAVPGTWPPKEVGGGDFPYRAGIPVYSKEDYERQKKRFLLKDATWTVLD